MMEESDEKLRYEITFFTEKLFIILLYSLLMCEPFLVLLLFQTEIILFAMWWVRNLKC